MRTQNEQMRGRRLAAAPPPAAVPRRPYQWRNTPGWDPAAVVFRQATVRPSALAAQAGLRRRRAEFTRLREAGVDVATASQLCGVTARTGRAYERARLGLGGAP